MKLRSALLGASILLIAGCSNPFGQFGRAPGPTTSSDQRVASFQAKLARKPDSIKALNGLGAEYARRSAWARAAGAYREALIVNATDREALIGYSTSQSALSDYGTALDHAERALASKADIASLIAAAVALNGQGQHLAAKGYLDQALALNPRDLDVRNNLALTLALAKNSIAYDMQRGVAFAPDSDFRHHRNFFVIAGILGKEKTAAHDGRALRVSAEDQKKLFAIGKKARSKGMRAFGLATKL